MLRALRAHVYARVLHPFRPAALRALCVCGTCLYLPVTGLVLPFAAVGCHPAVRRQPGRLSALVASSYREAL